MNFPQPGECYVDNLTGDVILCLCFSEEFGLANGIQVIFADGSLVFYLRSTITSRFRRLV